MFHHNEGNQCFETPPHLSQYCETNDAPYLYGAAFAYSFRRLSSCLDTKARDSKAEVENGELLFKGMGNYGPG